MLILLMTKPVLVNIKSLMISENWGSTRNIKSHNCVFIELPPHAMVSSLKILCMVYVPVLKEYCHGINTIAKQHDCLLVALLPRFYILLLS